MSPASRPSATRIVNAGLSANAILAAVKTTVGILGHSPALLADGINSTSDVAYYVVVKIFLHLAHKPPDREHPYGHSQLESIAALVVGSFIITTAIALFWNAVNKVHDFFAGGLNYGGPELSAFWVAVATVLVKIVLTVLTRRVGQRSGNAAVLALAQDHRNDVLSAFGAALGIFFGQRGYPWADPLVSGLVAFCVLATGIQILRESSADLMDTVPGQTLERQTREILRAIPGLQEVEEVHAHRFGPYFVLNVTIGVEATLTVAQGDSIASQVEQALCRELDFVLRVYVHYHPVRNPGRGS